MMHLNWRHVDNLYSSHQSTILNANNTPFLLYYLLVCKGRYLAKDCSIEVFIFNIGKQLLIIFRLNLLRWLNLRSDMKRNLDKIPLMDLFVSVDSVSKMVASITMQNIHLLIKHRLLLGLDRPATCRYSLASLQR